MNKLNVNNKIKVYDLINDKYKNFLWGLRLINVENIWLNLNYENLSKIKIALIDSGVDSNHEDLRSGVCSGYNFIDNNNNITDEFGHGTRVAGVILAEKNNNLGIAGVASGAKLIPLKVLNSKGKGSIQNVIKALNWCLNNDVDIINLSIGYQKDIQELIMNNNEKYYKQESNLINELLKKGIVIVSSVGNNNDLMCYPACIKGVISVASYGINSDTLEIYPAPKNNICDIDTIYAPGEGVLTTDINNTYTYDFGSSIACGFVAGAIALLKSINNNLTPNEIHHLLLKTCSNVKYKNENLKLLNVDAAYHKIKYL